MTTTRSRRRLWCAAASLTTAAVLLAGCGGNDPDPIPEGTDAHVAIDPLDPAALGPDEAAAAAMNAILSWQPATDTSKADALTRARPWLGGALAGVVDTSPTAGAGLRPDREWAAWARSGDTLTATCTRAPDSPNSPAGMTTVIVDLSCRQQVLHASGSVTPRAPEVWRTTAVATPDGWRVTDFRYRT
ncbi:hypothetical protein HQ602_17180 [Rhodococcus kroppenstedtii]|uniref:hypothetical protein n=1 Tax=Rhodococcoides kroppenstedtii TaxID=293050 RepID=UPI001C9A354A|nr:hypothetical protein [Rhodococcus kroppenstedtii]MBY6438109.1 hypothetical protein [Rhodococcus kroppenstedtii]